MALKYGGDYNPEQWPESVWIEDVQLMHEAGVNFVTVGVFSWSMLEPSEGNFEFGWLDRVLDLLHENGIAVDLATATASPPPWLSQTYPETLPVDRTGTTLWPGGRQDYCPSSPIYRALAVRLAGKIAERYAEHPAVVMWHINNEYGCHLSECYCDQSAVAFRHWLRAKYSTIDALNEAWTTEFWSQRYTSFDQVLPPRITPVFVNPSQRLDFKRFSSSELLACFLAEKAAIRTHSTSAPVTTNFIGLFRHVDYWKWIAEIDVISDDSYPDPLDPNAALDSALARDLMRSLGGGKPWLLLEQAPGYVNWRTINGTKPGTMMQALSMQAVARGADGINFFQWRQSRGGSEKFHSGMIPHSGTNSRVWRNVVDLGNSLSLLDDVVDQAVHADVAFVLDWESWWAAEGEAHQIRLDFHRSLLDWYRPFYESNTVIDFVQPSSPLEGYKLVVAPHLYLYTDESGDNLNRYVNSGGKLIATYFTGHVDEHDRARLGGYLGPLQNALGLSVDDFAALPVSGPDSRIRATSARWGEFEGSQWSEYVRLQGAEVLARFAGQDVEGLPAFTRNRHGSGSAWYFATKPDPASLGRIVRDILAEAGVRSSAPELPIGVEAVQRGPYLFVINQTSQPIPVDLDGYAALPGSTSIGPVLSGYDTLVLTRLDAELVESVVATDLSSNARATA